MCVTHVRVNSSGYWSENAARDNLTADTIFLRCLVPDACVATETQLQCDDTFDGCVRAYAYLQQLQLLMHSPPLHRVLFAVPCVACVLQATCTLVHCVPAAQHPGSTMC